MITIYDLKPKFQALLRPLVALLAKQGIRPNQVTWAALLLSLAAGAAVGLSRGASWALLLMPPVLFMRMALNAIDGILAKEYNMKTAAGAMLNEMGDVLSDVALYLPFALAPDCCSPYLIVVFVITGCLAETAGIAGAAVGSQRRYDGPMGKSDRAFFMGCIALLSGLNILAALWVNVLLAIAILMGLWTTIRRAVRGIA